MQERKKVKMCWLPSFATESLKEAITADWSGRRPSTERERKTNSSKCKELVVISKRGGSLEIEDGRQPSAESGGTGVF